MDSIKKEWVTEPGKIDNEVVSWAANTGEYLANGGLTPSTIRRFFGEMRRIQSNFEEYKEDVPLLKAKLAYDVGRKYKKKTNRDGSIKEEGKGVKDFYTILSPGIEAVDGDKNRFNRFVKIAEAIVAFHRQYNKVDD